MKKKRKTLIVAGVISFVIIILLIFSVAYKNSNKLFPPLLLLQKENVGLSRKKISNLNNQYINCLLDKKLLSDKLTYLEDGNKYQDNKYVGRFVSSDLYTYQFTIDINKETVKIVEIAKIQIDREALTIYSGSV